MDEYKVAAISNRILNTLSDIRNNEELFDFTILVQDEVFKVHKFFLAACSGYFRAMLRHDSLETDNNQVRIRDINASTMNDIINFCYTRDIKLNADNVQETLKGASFLQIEELIAVCAQSIKAMVERTNCFEILMLAERYSLDELFDHALSCLDSFEHVSKEEEFLRIDQDFLNRIISSDKLYVKNENFVFDAIIRWIDYDMDNRLPGLEQLLNHVRFALMDSRKLADLSSHKYIKDSVGCLRLLMHGKDFQLLEKFPEHRANMIDTRFERRYPRRKQNCILIVTNWYDSSKSMLEKYDLCADEWLQVSQMTRKSRFGAVAIIGDNLYLLGSSADNIYSKSVARYDILNDTWHYDVPDMILERSEYTKAVSLDGYLYVMGGESNSFPTTVEKYDPESNSWTICKSPTQKVPNGFHIAVLNGLIYVMPYLQHHQNTCNECYDPKTDEWRNIATMKTMRKDFGCVAYDGKIYAIGGEDSFTDLSSAECYDPEWDCWMKLPDMGVRRGMMDLVTMNKLIYIVLCKGQGKRLVTLEAYDPATREWLEKALRELKDSDLSPPMISLSSNLIVQHVVD